MHAIESHNLDQLPGDKVVYAGREQLCRRPAAAAAGGRPGGDGILAGNAIPYVSRVDAGTIETVRQLGTTVVSSGDLAQRFEAIWTDAALATHIAAAERLYRIKDRAFDLIRQRIVVGDARSARSKSRTRWSGGSARKGLIADTPPNVSAQENAGNPHYQATQAVHRAIRPNEVVLIDLWGKLPTPGAVYADITWMGFTGTTPPPEFAAAFAAARDGRDAAVDLVQSAVLAGRELRGFEVDRACRAVIERAGFGAQFIHRTGPQPGRERARQRRPHGRLRDARRPPADARHGLHD